MAISIQTTILVPMFRLFFFVFYSSLRLYGKRIAELRSVTCHMGSHNVLPAIRHR